MKTSVVFTVLATCAAMATASFQPPEKDTTTTMTSTVTMTYTLTECESDVPDCPINKPPPTPSPEAPYVPEPAKESDAEVAPAYPTSSSSAEYAAPLETSSYEVPAPDYSSKPIATSTSVVDAGSSNKPPVAVSGASGLSFNSLVLGVVAIGAALLA